MSGWDASTIFHSRQHAPSNTAGEDGSLLRTVGTTEGIISAGGLSGSEAKRRFRQFILSFRVGRFEFKYRERLQRSVHAGENILEVDLDDLQNFDRQLANAIRFSPADFVLLFERASEEVSALLDNTEHGTGEDTVLIRSESQREKGRDSSIQILFTSSERPQRIRELQSASISRLIRMSGIVIAASPSMLKARQIRLECRNCHDKVQLKVQGGLGGIMIPRYCSRQRMEGEEHCPLDPYAVLPDESVYVDQQTIKLQELPEEVPSGEMPRSLILSVDRHLVGKAVPGMRISVVGIYAINASSGGKSGGSSSSAAKATIRTPYVQVLGLEALDDDAGGRSSGSFDLEVEEEMLRISRIPNLYELISKSIAPEIFGFEDIKKAMAALLFGGSRKIIPDGMRVRGDINVLLLGDPSTAKSQVLKFVEKVAPISVYTSGKGSSAAGLTAAVIQDAGSREFHLEGGAMVLADGGVVCIDEFDKMRLADRVAIHEAMEQQTISIAKAGLTAVLNARSSVLAAANPAFGRYDDTRSATENIEFQSTILSRFDLMFIVRDIRTDDHDGMIARHVLGLHQRGSSAPSTTTSDDHIDIGTLKKYIEFARSRCSPRLTSSAAELLRNNYVTIRQQMRQAEFEEDRAQQVPITVRQLEAVVRIAEALAKMSLTPNATERHVAEAIRLFKVSTLESAHSDVNPMTELNARPEFLTEVQTCEDAIRRRLPVGSIVSDRRLREGLEVEGFSRLAVARAIDIMIRRKEVEPRSQRKRLFRLR